MLVRGLKTGIGQFSHYRFNMVNLMYKWAKEAGLSYRAGDPFSEEGLRPLRFGMLQAGIFAATIAGSTNFRKLAPNETMDYGESVWHWLTADRDDPKQLEKLDKATYGQRGAYFLGPNINYAMSLMELFDVATMGERKDEQSQFIHTESLKHVKKDANKEKYDNIALINSQLARTWAYTIPAWFGGAGLKDASYLELGLHNNKEQRKMTKQLKRSIARTLGIKSKKRKKKTITKGMSAYDREAALKALSGM
jgi:hypothetical protein